MHTLLLTIHLWLRWAVILFGLIGAVRILMSRGDIHAISRGHKVHGTLFVSALDLAWVVGLGLLVMTWSSADQGAALTHGAVMTAAVAVAHVLRIRAKRGEGNQPFSSMLAFLLPLGIVLAGHLILP